MKALRKDTPASALRKAAEPIFERLRKLERRVEEIGAQPVPPPNLRKSAEPADDPAYDGIADLLEKAARAGLGREFDDAATHLRRRCDSAPAMAASTEIDLLSMRGWK
jgi:hypothetical protein